MSSYTQRNNPKRLSGIEFYDLLHKGEIPSPSVSDLKSSNRMFNRYTLQRSTSVGQKSENKPVNDNYNFAASAAAAAASASKISYSEAIPRSTLPFSNMMTARNLANIKYSKSQRKSSPDRKSIKPQKERKRKRRETSSLSASSPADHEFSRFSQTFITKSPLSGSKTDQYSVIYDDSSIGAQSAHPYEPDDFGNSAYREVSSYKVEKYFNPGSLEQENDHIHLGSPKIVQETFEDNIFIDSNNNTEPPNQIMQVKEIKIYKPERNSPDIQTSSQQLNMGNESSMEKQKNELNEKRRNSRLMAIVMEEEKTARVLKRKKKFKLKDKSLTGISIDAHATRGDPISLVKNELEARDSNSNQDIVYSNIGNKADTSVAHSDDKEINKEEELHKSREALTAEDMNTKNRKSGSTGMNFFKRFNFGKKGNKGTEQSNEEKVNSKTLFSRKKNQEGLNSSFFASVRHPNGFQHNLGKQDDHRNGTEMDNSISDTLRTLKSYPMSNPPNINRSVKTNAQTKDSSIENRINVEASSNSNVTIPVNLEKNVGDNATYNNGTGSSVSYVNDKELESLIKQNNKLDEKLNSKEAAGSEKLTDSEDYSGNEMTVMEKL